VNFVVPQFEKTISLLGTRFAHQIRLSLSFLRKILLLLVVFSLLERDVSFFINQLEHTENAVLTDAPDHGDIASQSAGLFQPEFFSFDEELDDKSFEATFSLAACLPDLLGYLSDAQRFHGSPFNWVFDRVVCFCSLKIDC